MEKSHEALELDRATNDLFVGASTSRALEDSLDCPGRLVAGQGISCIGSVP